MFSRPPELLAVPPYCVRAWFAGRIVLSNDCAWFPCPLDGVVDDNWLSRQELSLVEASATIVVLCLGILALLVGFQVLLLVVVAAVYLSAGGR